MKLDTFLFFTLILEAPGGAPGGDVSQGILIMSHTAKFIQGLSIHLRLYGFFSGAHWSPLFLLSGGAHLSAAACGSLGLFMRKE